MRLRRKRLWRMVGAAVAGMVALASWLALRGEPDVYVPGERTTGLTDSLGRSLPADAPAVRFTDVTGAAGLAFRHFPGRRANRLPEDMGSGVALADVDGDGWIDVFLANAAGPLSGRESGWAGVDGRCRLYRNQGDGTFEDVTEAAGLGVQDLVMAGTFADVDGDRDLDLLLTSYGSCRLFRNEDGCFTDVSEAAGVAGFDGFWTGAAAGDPDRDGDVDLYVCGYVKYVEVAGGAEQVARQYDLEIPALINPSAFEAQPNLLFRNRGDGTFEEVARATGTDNATGRSLSAAFADLSGDGWPDLYVANDVSDNALFLNLGDGTFEDRATRSLVGDYRGAMGLAVGDFDGDLDQDLFITHWVGQENALYGNLAAENAAKDNTPAMMFIDDADRVGLGQIALDRVGWATGFFDLDRDGRRDLFVVNGHTIPGGADKLQLRPMRDQLFWNGGDRGYFEVGGVAGEYFQQEHVGRGGALFDYDQDGDEDLLVCNFGESPVLLRNDTATAAHGLTVRLRQPDGNTFAIGATVKVLAGERTTAVLVETQGSYLSQHAVGDVLVGLGDAAQAYLVVTWPDGVTEQAGPFPADRQVTWMRGAEPRVALLPGLLAADREGPTDLAQKRRFFQCIQEARAARLGGDLPEAERLYREALGLWPGHGDSLYYLANLLVETGRETEALALFQDLALYEPRTTRAWMQVGRLRLPGGAPELDDLELARAAFERAHARNVEQSGPVLMRGLVALLGGRLEEADECFADTAALNPRSVEARYWRGLVAWIRADDARAAALLAEARSIGGTSGAGQSVSNEGDTKTGRALTAEERALAPALLRWQDLAARGEDAATEYAATLAALRGLPQVGDALPSRSE